MSTENDGKTLILMLIAVLVYFVSYFFLYIVRDSVNVLSVDYITALISLIPVMVTILMSKKFSKIELFDSDTKSLSPANLSSHTRKPTLGLHP